MKITLEELGNGLAALNMPVAYRMFKHAQEPPYIVFLSEGSANFGADNIVYKPLEDVRIELYTEDKDPSSEAIVENYLTGAGLYYDKYEDYIEDENIYQTTYSIRRI